MASAVLVAAGADVVVREWVWVELWVELLLVAVPELFDVPCC